MVKNNVFIIIFFLIIIFLIGNFYNNYLTKETIRKKIYFEVNRVEESKSFRCYYYNKYEEVLPVNYTFYSPSKIKKGDIITKDSDSDELIIYRTDTIHGKTRFTIKLK